MRGCVGRRIALDAPATLRAVELGGARVERLAVVGELRHRADGRAAGLDRRLSIDGDACGHWIELVDVRPREPLEELPRVGAEALDVAPLALRVERAEGERRLTRAGRSDDGDEGAGLEVEIDRAQVVGARTTETSRAHSGLGC